MKKEVLQFWDATVMEAARPQATATAWESLTRATVLGYEKAVTPHQAQQVAAVWPAHVWEATMGGHRVGRDGPLGGCSGLGSCHRFRI